MQKPETNFKEWVVPQLNAIPGVFAFKTQMVSVGGVPDLCITVNGTTVWWELKIDPKEDPSPRQRWFMRKLRKAGAKTYLVHPKNFPWHLKNIKRLAYG